VRIPVLGIDPPATEKIYLRIFRAKRFLKFYSAVNHWVAKLKISWHGPCNTGRNFNITMNNSFIKNLAFNFTAGALALTAFAYTNLNAEITISLFAAVGLAGIMLRDYQQPSFSKVEPRLRPALVKTQVCRRHVAALVAA